MKQTTEPRSTRVLLRAAWRTLCALRPERQALTHFLLALTLSGVCFGYGSTPAGVCLLAVCGANHMTAGALGALVGYGLFWGIAKSFEPYALLAVIVCARMLFPRAAQSAMVQRIAVAACAAIGLLFAAAARFSLYALLRYGSNVLCCGGLMLLLRSALRHRSFPAQVAVSCTLALGLAGIHPPLCPVPALLAWMAAAPTGLPLVAAAGAVLTFAAPQAVGDPAVFGLACLLSQSLRRRPAGFRLAAALAVYALSAARLHRVDFLLCAAVGGALSLFVPPQDYLPAPPEPKLPEQPVQRVLLRAAKALGQACDMLSAPLPNQNQEIAAIFDNAAAQVCRSCAKTDSCWNEYAGESYEDLASCAAQVLARGTALAEDFPARFRARCLHFEAFLTASNDAMENARARHRLRRRLDETRRAAGMQYEMMSNYLRELSVRIDAPGSVVNFAPELSVRAAGCNGSTISGDRGAAFAGPDATYYLLLCDGMGTGPDAAQESTQAICLLRRLLQGGLDAENALRALNGIYILRDNGCFSTVDLLRINLTSADAILYKWGAAPSYLRRAHGLRRLGGATLPPGLSQTETMEQIRVSLEHGSVLVLMTDGLGGKESQHRLESCDSLCPQDVTGSLFIGRECIRDDCTAVAVRLRPAAMPCAVME